MYLERDAPHWPLPGFMRLKSGGCGSDGTLLHCSRRVDQQPSQQLRAHSALLCFLWLSVSLSARLAACMFDNFSVCVSWNPQKGTPWGCQTGPTGLSAWGF